MCFKSFSFCLSWCEIFDKDRETGVHAVGTLHNNNNVGANDYVPIGLGTNFQIFGKEEEFRSVCRLEGSARRFASISKKGKSTNTSTDDRFFSMMHNFCDRTGDTVKDIGYEYNVCEARKAVYDALGSLLELTMGCKIWVAKQLLSIGKDMDLFFNLPNEATVEMVRTMLIGAF